MDHIKNSVNRKNYHTTENFSKHLEIKEKKEKNFQMPIDLSNKINTLIDNLELMSSPIVGDYYVKRKQKQNKINNEIQRKTDYFLRRNSLYGKKSLEETKKFYSDEKIKKNNLFDTSTNKQFFNTSMNMNKSESYLCETNTDLNKNRNIPLKLLKFKDSFYSNNTNFSNKLKNFTHYYDPKSKKIKSVQNKFIQMNQNSTRNVLPSSVKKVKIIRSSSKNFDLVPKDESYFTKDTTKISFNLPSLSQTQFTNLDKPRKHNIHHVKFHSSSFQPDLSTKSSEFFKLTNVVGNTGPSKLSKSTTKLDKIAFNNFKTNFNPFFKENHNQRVDKMIKSESIDFTLNNTPLTTGLNLKDKDIIQKFLNTCDEENKISQYTFDVMEKFVKKALPNRLLHNRFSIEQINEDNMFRLKNFAKNYFIFCEDKDLFISDDYGISEMLNFSKRINGIHPGGSYKFRKIIGDRIGVNVLEEGNHLRLVKLKKPSDMIDLKLSQKFKKQHENIINTLELMNNKKKNIKQRKLKFVT